MIYDYRLHGVMGEIEYFAYVFGPEAKNSLFHEEALGMIRFFSRGNEFTLETEKLHYKGTGGHFCEYMFGVEKPLKDMLKREVRNRLIMFGAIHTPEGGITFTDNIEGSETLSDLFMHGNAVKNYFFFVSSDIKEPYHQRQQNILGSVGKFLKRTPLVSENRDTDLILELYKSLNEPESTILLFSLIHKGNEKFYNAYSESYRTSREVSGRDAIRIANLAVEQNIDYYQQERMKIDIMYRHPENKAIVDEYHDILISNYSSETLSPSESARLRRLKMLRIRNNIPSLLFEALDNLLLGGKELEDEELPEYLKEARAIMENIFFRDPLLKSHIIKEDIVKLIYAKHRSYLNGDREFERILLDIGKTCDEYSKKHGDFSLLEDFSAIVSYFDRYDHVQATVSQIAFMENYRIKEETLRSLFENHKVFNKLREGLFNDIFIGWLFQNRYLTSFGRRKIILLSEGLGKIITGDMSIADLMEKLNQVTHEERSYKLAYSVIKENIRGIYSQLDSPGIRDEIRKMVEKEITKMGDITEIPEHIFRMAIIDLKKEHFYMETLLPQIIGKRDSHLREDFFANSGLDRFHIETLERLYAEEHHIPLETIESIR